MFSGLFRPHSPHHEVAHVLCDALLSMAEVDVRIVVTFRRDIMALKDSVQLIFLRFLVGKRTIVRSSMYVIFTYKTGSFMG